MASDFKTSSEDADMAECSGEKVVTMMDVLQDQEEFEEDANAVLGASDEKSCTYSKGYIKRQALYACLTCCSEAKLDPTKRAGVCLACSLMCHENHDLVELYTKRNFRCDCGNPNFNSHPCTFTPIKTDFNEDNIYNQNFSGLYCNCQRPYPDPKSTEEVEMIQCIICEDWLHTTHLESTVPANNQYSEMICKDCMIKNDFLHDYCDFAVNAESADVDIVNVNGVDNNKDTLPNNDDLETNTTSNVNGTKSDLEMTETHLETNINLDDSKKEVVEINENKNDSTTIINENSEINDTLKESVDDKQEENMSELMKTEESEEKPTLAQEEATSNITPNSSNNREEDSNITEAENTKDISDNTAPEIQENCNSSKTHIDNIDDQNEIGKSIEEQNKQDDEKQNVDKEQKNTDEEKEQDAEKMEEDRLLADPDDDKEKSVPVEEKDNIIEEHSASKVAENITTNTNSVPEIEVTRPDNEQNSEDKPKVSNEQTDDAITIDTQNEITIQPENEEDKGPKHSDIPSENCKVESNSTDKILEKRKHEEESSDNQPKKQKLEDKCIRPKGVKRFITGATFWTSNFRQKLCTCQECISMYKDLSVLFLTDPEDTVSAYEHLGKEKTNGKPVSQYERGVDALLSLDRIQQINALTEYNRMRDRLLDYLKSFKDKKEIVKEEDIRAFFAEMKPKRQSDGVYFCR